MRRIFLAGALGVIGRRLAPLLRDRYDVAGTTRSPDRKRAIAELGLTPVVVDAFDAHAMMQAVAEWSPDVVIHQLTDLPDVLDPSGTSETLARNARLRIEGTRNLVAAAVAARTKRIVAQSICFAYAPGCEPHKESDQLAGVPEGAPSQSVQGVLALEGAVLAAGVESVVLRYGRLYGPGTWTVTASGKAPLHVDAAAHAALLAITHGSGIYNIAEDDGSVSIARAKADLGFDSSVRLP